MREGVNARDAATALLYRREREGVDISEGLKSAFAGELRESGSRERAFLRRLALGTVKRQITLDFALNDIASVKTGDMKPLVRVILRLGLYQILYMESVRDAAAVDEAVKAVRRGGLTGLSGFVNGVLRRAVREKERLLSLIEAADMGVRHGMPDYPFELITGERGEERAERIFAALDEDRPVTLRPNPAVLKDKEALDKWAEDIGAVSEARRHRLVPDMLTVREAGDITRLPGFDEGAFAVQDASGVLAVRAAGIYPEARVLDICAAPGSKALCAAAGLVSPENLTAWDISEKRLGAIRQNADRLKLSGINAAKKDASVLDESQLSKWDIVLCDPPCTGFGVMGRKPDIRFSSSPEKTESLVMLQRRILSCAARYLRPGGVLIYSTCTISVRENEDNVRFITESGDVRTEDWDTGVGGLDTRDGMVQLYPGEWETDGFFIAKMVKAG